MLWEILTREVPYAGWDTQDIAKAVIAGDKLKDSSIMQLDPRLADLIRSCRDVDPNKRPKFE